MRPKPVNERCDETGYHTRVAQDTAEKADCTTRRDGAGKGCVVALLNSSSTRVGDQEKDGMVTVVREPPNTGYALEVDGRLKTEFETKEGAWTGAEELKKRFPMLRVKIYDAETKTTEEFRLPSS
jgi:hypothetical protein